MLEILRVFEIFGHLHTMNSLILTFHTLIFSENYAPVLFEGSAHGCGEDRKVFKENLETCKSRRFKGKYRSSSQKSSAFTNVGLSSLEV